MKYLKKLSLVVFLLLIISAVDYPKSFQSPVTITENRVGFINADLSFSQKLKQVEKNSLDLATVFIESPATRELLGIDEIKVRNPSSEYSPDGIISVLQTEIIDEEIYLQRLQDVIKMYSHEEINPRNIEEMGDIFTAKIGTAVYRRAKLQRPA